MSVREYLRSRLIDVVEECGGVHDDEVEERVNMLVEYVADYPYSGLAVEAEEGDPR